MISLNRGRLTSTGSFPELVARARHVGGTPGPRSLPRPERLYRAERAAYVDDEGIGHDVLALYATGHTTTGTPMDEWDRPQGLGLWDLVDVDEEGQVRVDPASFDEQWTSGANSVHALHPVHQALAMLLPGIGSASAVRQPGAPKVSAKYCVSCTTCPWANSMMLTERLGTPS